MTPGAKPYTEIRTLGPVQRQADRTQAKKVARGLTAAGHRALFAGGCVRDHLRGEKPKDFDIATSATPEQVMELFPETKAVGAAFGVVLVLQDGAACEVATFREDVGILDGRHPKEVRFTDAEEDANRRDFTINGLFEDPLTGEIFDYVGGREDLNANLVRRFGDAQERFREDRLRKMRAVRYATELDFRLDPATADAIRADAGAIEEVAQERLRDELNLMLLSGHAGRGIGLMHELGLLEILLPEVAALDGVPQPPQYHPEGDVLTHTRLLCDTYHDEGLPVALACMLHDIGKATTTVVHDDGKIASPKHAGVGAEMTEEVLRRFRYPNRIIEHVTELVARHMDLPTVPLMREAKRRRFLFREDFDDLLELHRIDCTSSHGMLDIYESMKLERERILAEPPPLEPLLHGRDLIELGFVPGPAFSVMLKTLVDAQLEDRIRTRPEAEKFILDRFAKPDGRTIAGGTSE